MAKLPCIIKAPCPDDANPFENLSSEDPDINRFFAYGSGPGRITPGNPSGPGGNGPPPGFNWNTNCNTADGPITCAATSLEEALLCVARLGQLCAGDSGDPNTPEDPSTPDGQPAFYSTLQECAALCPDGNLFLFQVAAGAFVGSSQILADRMALSYACRQAELSRICFGTLSRTAACTGTSFSGTIRVTTSFSLVSVQVIGGALPPGITMSNSASTILFSGTPTTPGNYSFTIRAVNNHGNFMIKSFTIYVLGFTNAALDDFAESTPYSFQLTADGGTPPYTFAVTGGALPAGLTMDSAGLISGTPTESGTFDFSATITDDEGRTCSEDYSLFGVSVVGFKICDFDYVLSQLSSVTCTASVLPAWNGIFNLSDVWNNGFNPNNPFWYFLGQSLNGQAVAPDDGAPNYPGGDWQSLDTFARIRFTDLGGFTFWMLELGCVNTNQFWFGIKQSDFGVADPAHPEGTYEYASGDSPGPATITINAVAQTCCQYAAVGATYEPTIQPARVRIQDYATDFLANVPGCCPLCDASGDPAWDGTMDVKYDPDNFTLSYMPTGTTGGGPLFVLPALSISGMQISNGILMSGAYFQKIQVIFRPNLFWELSIICFATGQPGSQSLIWRGIKGGDIANGQYARNGGSLVSVTCLTVESY